MAMRLNVKRHNTDEIVTEYREMEKRGQEGVVLEETNMIKIV